MIKSKFCVFCGKVPESKNREHVLPQWLLNLTGNPSRIAKFGYNFKTDTCVRFSWKSLVVPACKECNSRYAELERLAKPIVEDILLRKDVSVADYLIILDWLDKVRVGLWLNYHLIQESPIKIVPQFHIDQRIGKKDRFVAIYPLSKQPQGLNAFGVETPIFHGTPSVFALRINDVLILNCSSDFIIAGRCGLVFPKVIRMHLDGPKTGYIECSDHSLLRKVKNPLFPYKIYKPSVYLLQPITQMLGEGNKDSELINMGGNLPPDTSYGVVGKLFQQHPGRIERLDDTTKMIRFQNILATDSVSMGHLISQVYQLQIWLQKRVAVEATSPELLEQWNQYKDLLIKINEQIVQHYLVQRDS